MLENAVDGGKARTDHLVDADGAHEREIAEFADAGDALADAHAPGQQGGQNVGLLVVGQSDHGIHFPHVLLGQKPLVRPVAVQHHGLVEALGQPIAFFRFPLDDFAGNGLAFEQGGQAVADPSAADDEDPLEGRLLLAEDGQGFLQLLAGRDVVHQIAGHEAILAAGDDQFFVAHDGRDQRPDPLQLGGEVDQFDVVKGGMLVQIKAHEHNAPVSEFPHVHRAGNLHHTVDGLDHLDVGVDDRIDVGGFLAEGVVIVVVVGVAETGQFLGGG